MKYRELLNNITEVAKNHPNINSTFIGDVYELNHRNDVDYCSFVITQGTHRVNSDEDYIDYTLNLFYVDRLTADESNRTQIHSSGIDFMNSLLRAVEKLGVVVVEHTENVFNERFNDVCAGVYATVVLRVDIDECGQTIEIITPDELKVLEVTKNGIYDGLFKQVDVNVKGGGKEPVLETLNVNDNGTYRPKTGVDGFDIVEVNIPKEIHNVTSKSITENGTYYSDGNDVWNRINVNLKLGALTNLYDLRFKETTTGINTAEYNSVLWTAMDYLFKDCVNLESLNLSGWNTRMAVNMSNMFRGCSKLTSLNLSGWNTSKVEYMHNMFNNCSSLTSLDLSHFDTSNVTDMNSMFISCQSLKSLNLSGLDTRNVTNIKYMFYLCKSLETINCDGLQLPDIDMSQIGLNNSTKLTVDSIVGLLNALPTTTNGYSLQIGQTNIDKLSEEQKAIATNKNWRLV